MFSKRKMAFFFQGFKNREEAGQRLAAELTEYAHQEDGIVLAIPRGGVVVGAEVAHRLGLPLDVIIPRKIGAPNQPELAIGAVVIADSEPIILLDELSIRQLMVPQWYIEEETQHQVEEIHRRAHLYREGRPPSPLRGKTAILVDDGIATGYTLRAAVKAVRKQQPSLIVVAVPVAPPDSVARLKAEADRVIALLQPEYLLSVGSWYEDFRQVEDEEVIRLLKENAQRQ